MLFHLKPYLLLLILIWTSACGGFFVPDEGDSKEDNPVTIADTDTQTDESIVQVRTPYDGMYRMILRHEEAPNADNNFMPTHSFFTVDLNIDLGQGLFSVIPNTDQGQTTVDGDLSVNGEGVVQGFLRIESEQKELAVDFQNARVAGGLIRGDYTQQETTQLVGGRFSGIRQNYDNLTEAEKATVVVNAFDGSYQLSWSRHGQQRLYSCVEVKDGLISQSIPDGFSLIGAVDPTGELVFFSTTLSSVPTNGEGKIDANGDIQGIYYVESGSGQFTGERVESCTAETLPELSQPDVTQHSLCVVENDTHQNTNAPNQSFLSILLQLSREPNKLYCQPSDRCEWLDQSLRTFENSEACEQECQRQNGECLGRNNNRPRAVIEAEGFYDVGALVEVDGSQSLDINGDVLAYHWEFVQLPPESQVTLLQPSLANPSFRPDLPGVYQLQLIVNDGIIDSVPERITVTVSNTPAANAGEGHSVLPNIEATLDGSLSSDVNGDELTYEWKVLEQPEGSDITLNTPNEAITTWIPTTLGHYLFELTVSDGVTSHSDQVRVKVNSPPVIVFEGPSTANANELVVIDASKSFDPDQDPLQVQWALAKPAGSNSVLNRNDMSFSFTPDIAGDYNVQLTLDDGLSHTIRFHILTITAPVANAGEDQVVSAMRTTLDGTASFDPEGSALTYQWEVIDSPQHSRFTLNEANTATPSLETNTAGDYVLQLTVSDEYASSSDTTIVQTSLEWELVEGVAWPKRDLSPADRGNNIMFVLNDELWAVGGIGYPSPVIHEAWRSSDGENWEFVESSGPWQSTSVHFNFDNKIWVINTLDRAEVWNSSDGITWNQVNSNFDIFIPDGWTKGAAIVFNGKIWFFANTQGGVLRSSSDGIHWTAHQINMPRGIHPVDELVVLDGKMWAFQSSSHLASSTNPRRYYTLTSSNGVDWEIVKEFSEEETPFFQVNHPMVYENQLWLLPCCKRPLSRSINGAVWNSIIPQNNFHPAHVMFKPVGFKDSIWMLAVRPELLPHGLYNQLVRLRIDDLPEL